ncbi:MAG TPA: CsbD family protein [Steroidobacteraceae bacterium]|nr:CsbD family protein [Steroidobacteraceae bacterium]
MLIKDDSANNKDATVDKDRIKGSAEQIKGTVKEAVGKVLGDEKMETEGATDKAAGKVQNAVGGLKDAVRGK